MTVEFENEIIRSVLGGNANASEALVTENEAAIFSLCLRMCGDRSDAADLTQEAFLKAYRSLGSFRGDCRFSSWLRRIASSVCLDFLRSKSKKREQSLSIENDDGEEAELEIPDLRELPEDSLMRERLRDSVRRGMERLPEEQRRILVLRELGGLGYEEIADKLGIECGTVKSRIFRARKRLCAFLIKDGNIPDSFSSSLKGCEEGDRL